MVLCTNVLNTLSCCCVMVTIPMQALICVGVFLYTFMDRVLFCFDVTNVSKNGMELSVLVSSTVNLIYVVIMV